MDCDEDVVDWILTPFEESDKRLFTSYKVKNGIANSIYKSLDATIMDVADDIAYGTHDLEDGIALNLITKEDWESDVEKHLDKKFAEYFDLTDIKDNLFSDDKSKSHKRKRALGAIIHALVKSVNLKKRNKFNSKIFDCYAYLNDEADEFLYSLKSVTFKKMIELHTVKTFEYRGQQILLSIVSAFEANPMKLLKPIYAEMYSEAKSSCEQKRIICDYVAGMTDDYAIRMYERLFIPRQGNVFDKL
jgi:dGTPase